VHYDFRKEAGMMTKKRKVRPCQVSIKPTHEKLPWPGLTAKDHLTRVVTRAVKEAKEKGEKEVWAGKQIARVLDYIPPEAAMRLVLGEMSRRGTPISRVAKSLLKLQPG
jgi:hypothetical protein